MVAVAGRLEQIGVYKEVATNVATLLKTVRRDIFVPENVDSTFVGWLDRVMDYFTDDLQNMMGLSFWKAVDVQNARYEKIAGSYTKSITRHGVSPRVASIEPRVFVEEMFSRRLPDTGLRLEMRIDDFRAYGRDIALLIQAGQQNKMGPVMIERLLDGFILPHRHSLATTPLGRTLNFDSMRLTRSEMTNAFHRADRELTAMTPWVTGLRWETQGTLEIQCQCADYDGTIYRPAEVPEPPHPLCMCKLTPQNIPESEWEKAVDEYFEVGRDPLGIAEWVYS